LVALGGTGLAFLPGEHRPPHAAIPGAGAESREPAAQARPSRPTAEVVDGHTQILTGRVLDADGRPVPHAAVTALVRRPWQPNDRGLQDQEVARATADAAGRYRLVVPNDFPTWYVERRVTLLAHAPGHAPITGEVSLRGRPAAIDLCLPGGAVAQGRLLDPDGRPAAGVRLAVVRLGRMTREIAQGEEPTPAPPGWPADTMTDIDGRFRLEGLAADDTPWLQVQDDRFALTTFALPVGAADPLTVTLAEPRLLVARVIAADTRQPLAGARLSVTVGTRPTQSSHYTALATAPGAAAAAPVTEVSGRADAEGRIRLRLPPGTDYCLSAYPPDQAPYVVGTWTPKWADGEANREHTLRLKPGVEVRGQVVEEDGRPVAGACVCYAVPRPRLPEPRYGDTMPFRDVAAVTSAGGHFRIVVPPGRCRLEVFGPSADYRPHSFEYEPCPDCIDGPLVRVMEHGFAPLSHALGDRPDPLRITLRRGTTVSGRVVGPDGEAICDGALVCRTVTHPLRSTVPRPRPIRDGVLELPGCVPGRTYPVFLLDPARRLGAIAELHVLDSGQSPPTIRLTECGTAKVRLVDHVGRPVLGQRPLLRVWLGHDRPSELDEPATLPRPGPTTASWFDTVNYLSGPHTNADGVAVLPALVPGLEYRVDFGIDGSWVSRSRPFRVAPGQTVRLPDMVIDEDGNGGHPGGTP
jgi:hypothetical protein